MFRINTTSLIFKTRLIGLIAAVFLILSTLLAVALTVYYDKKVEVDRAIMLYQTLFEQKPDDATFRMYLQMHHLTPIPMDLAMTVMQKGVPLLRDEGLTDTFKDANIEIFIFDGKYYYAYKEDTMYYFRSEAPMRPVKLYIIFTALVAALILFFLHRYVENSIKPLTRLHREIRRFGEGEKEIKTRTEGNDEVAEVANAFHDAVNTILSLERGRTLFLRNLLHELKTPIQKGKLIVYMMEEGHKDKEMLEKIFLQMEQHLNDLVQIESFTSKKITPVIRPHAAIDLFEGVMEKIDLEPENILHNIANQQVDVDFELFSLALKNLLDNARKYATGMPIELKWGDSQIEVINRGMPLEAPFETFIQPFTRDKTHHSLEGMGLGLYIANEILEQHGFRLEYFYADDRHYFLIIL